MKLSVVIHEAEEGGYWAEVPSIPGCATQGETFDELLVNLYEAVEACLAIDVQNIVLSKNDRILQKHFMKVAGIDESALQNRIR